MLTFIIVCIVIWVLVKFSQANKRRQQVEALHQLEQAIRNLPYSYRQNTTEYIRQDDKRKVVNYTAYLFGAMLRNFRNVSYYDLQDVIAKCASDSLGGYGVSNSHDEFYVQTMFELGQRGTLSDLDAAFDHLFMMKLVNVCDPGRVVSAMSIALGTTFGIAKPSTRDIEVSLTFLALVCVKLACRYEVALDIVKAATIQAGMSINFQAIKESQIQEACNKLGISRNTTREEFRRIKRNKLAQWHPDKAPAGQEQYYTSKYQEINGWCELVESQWK